MSAERDYSFTTLSQLSRRRREALHECATHERAIRHLWHGITHPRKQSAPQTTAQRIARIVNNGMFVVDGAVMAWKLYRKFFR